MNHMRSRPIDRVRSSEYFIGHFPMKNEPVKRAPFTMKPEGNLLSGTRNDDVAFPLFSYLKVSMI